VTPAALITRLVNFDGVFTPEELRYRYRLAQVDLPETTQGKAQFILLYGIPREDQYAHLASVLKAERAQGILVPEMRPGLWGASVIARRLAERNLPTTLIADNMIGIFFARHQIARALLFCSELSKAGPAGMCGLLLIALLAHAHKVPMELLAEEEETHVPLDCDVTTFLGHRVCPEGVQAYPINRDLVPWHLFHNP
jgi:methylthioribose-1-phosphate isomerase